MTYLVLHRKRLLAPELQIQVAEVRLSQVARAPREIVTEVVVALALMALCQWNQPSSQPIAMVNGIDVNLFITS